jgi:hypothetical protein
MYLLARLVPCRWAYRIVPLVLVYCAFFWFCGVCESEFRLCVVYQSLMFVHESKGMVCLARAAGVLWSVETHSVFV